MIGSANGQLQIVADKGSIPKWALEIWAGAWWTRYSHHLDGVSSDRSESCGGALYLADDVTRSETLLAAPSGLVVGEAIVNWQNEQVDGLLT